jgi:3-deoxy-7-phosphoheptulonate synthase
LFIVMRTYFEKPRTTTWWKWLINDPDLDGSCNIDKWLRLARELLLEINKIWIPTAIEFLDNISPQYFADLISWWAIWARTTESQLHRELTSWLSMPVWFKNWTTWDVKVALDAITAAKSSHIFLWATKLWKTAIIETSWNEDSHLILRWWSSGPNYKEEHIIDASVRIDEAWISTGIIVDLSHANSLKDHKRQFMVWHDIAKQIESWDEKIVWVMIEWNLQEWFQSYTPWKDNKQDLKPWVSITDKCVDWKTNEEILSRLNNAMNERITWKKSN